MNDNPEGQQEGSNANAAVSEKPVLSLAAGLPGKNVMPDELRALANQIETNKVHLVSLVIIGEALGPTPEQSTVLTSRIGRVDWLRASGMLHVALRSIGGPDQMVKPLGPKT